MRWRVVITDSESETGVAPTCPDIAMNHLIEDADGAPFRVADEYGVYDCCPGPHIECYSPRGAEAVCRALNEADAEMWLMTIPGQQGTRAEQDFDRTFWRSLALAAIRRASTERRLRAERAEAELIRARAVLGAQIAERLSQIARERADAWNQIHELRARAESAEADRDYWKGRAEAESKFFRDRLAKEGDG